MTISGTRYPFESEWAWLAGLIDGEGYIGIVLRSNQQLAKRMAISSITLPLLVKICERFGGKIHGHTPPKPPARQQFQWYTSGDHARSILHGVLPYLIVKREEAEIWLEFDSRPRPGRWGNKLKTHEREHRMALLARIQAIRKRAYGVNEIPAVFNSATRS